MLINIKSNNLNKYYKFNIINLFFNNNSNNNIIKFIINLLILNKLNYLFIINYNKYLSLNFVFYNYLILYFNDLNFNVKNLNNFSPLFSLNLYHEIRQNKTFEFSYIKNNNKLLNINFNSFTDSFYKSNILTKLSNSLSLTHKNLKLFDTNYI